jgi:hypothetical protein
MSSLDISIHLDKHFDIKQYQKMYFIMNALDQGWRIQKKGDSFIFSKKHEGKREIFKDSYLEEFIVSNFRNIHIPSIDSSLNS